MSTVEPQLIGLASIFDVFSGLGIFMISVVYPFAPISLAAGEVNESHCLRDQHEVAASEQSKYEG